DGHAPGSRRPGAGRRGSPGVRRDRVEARVRRRAGRQDQRRLHARPARGGRGPGGPRRRDASV
ncbi:MAG: RidA/YER057c/UK114 superfamily protein, partial [uncultured Acetobacteraceae bacterium]